VSGLGQFTQSSKRFLGKEIKIRALFSSNQCGPCVCYMGKGDKGRRRRRFIRDFWGIENIYLECKGKEWKKMYFMCDFNGRCLKC
jgi:hypothetical protein